jgi:RNA polymerase sigma factor (sigma-70 family)
MNLTNEFWEKAYKENAPKIIGVCRRYVKSNEVAEDLMQEAFITAINKADTYAGKGSFDAWLRKIAVNSALMYLRQLKSHKIIDNLIESECDHENMNDDNDIKSIIEEADFSEIELLEVIDSLPEHHKLVFNLYVIDGYTHIQIGKELNISPGTSKSHLARARKKIQQLLYQKAIVKNREQKKRKRSLLLLIIPCNLNYIDTIFRNKLGNFSIEPVKTFSFSGTSNLKKISIPKTETFFSNKIVFCAVFGLIIVVTVFYYKSISISPSNTDLKATDIVVPDTLNQQADTIRVEQQGEANSKKKEIKTLKNNIPVIIKQQVIQHKTVIIRDTIKIIDTTDVH